jgi:hypothetical protein
MSAISDLTDKTTVIHNNGLHVVLLCGIVITLLHVWRQVAGHSPLLLPS